MHLGHLVEPLLCLAKSVVSCLVSGLFYNNKRGFLTELTLHLVPNEINGYFYPESKICLILDLTNCISDF